MTRRAAPLLAGSLLAVMAGLLGLAARPDHPTLAMGSLLLAIFVIASAAWSIASTPRGEPFDVRILDAAAIALASMVLAVLGLGSAGLLSWWALLLLSGLAGGACSLLTGLRPRAGHALRWTGAWPPLLTFLPVALAAFAVVQAVLGRILRPPVGDPLAYHLPFAVEWLQHGRLVMLVPPAGDPSPPFYPLNSSIWIYWLLAPFESEVLARYVQLPFLLLLGLATFRLALELELPRQAALAAGALALSVPDIARSASLPENDLMLAALLVTATAYLARLYRNFSTWRALMAALVLGLAVGTKVLALSFAAPLGLVWIVLVLRGRRSTSLRQAVGLLLAGGLVVLAAGGYSYARNALVMDNPLYPAGYVVAGRTVLDGLYFPTWEWRRTHAFFPFDWPAFLLGSRRAFGLTITAWALPGFALAAAALVLELIRTTNERRTLIPALALLAWAPLTLGIFWFVIPYHFSRFLFASIVWGIVLAIWGLDRLWPAAGAAGRPPWYWFLTLPLIAYNLYNIPLDRAVRERPLYWLAAALVVGGVMLGAFLIQRVPRRNLPRLAAAAGALLAVGLVAAWPRYSAEYEQRKYDEWRLQIQSFNRLTDAWEWLGERTAGDPSVIAVAGTNEVFPLYGPALENELVTIWHSGERAAYDWDTPFVLYGAPSREDWEARVTEARVDYIVVTENVSFGGWPAERDWLLAAPERYALAFQNEDVEIWEVLGSRGSAARYTVPQGLTIQPDGELD